MRKVFLTDVSYKKVVRSISGYVCSKWTCYVAEVVHEAYGFHNLTGTI